MDHGRDTEAFVVQPKENRYARRLARLRLERHIVPVGVGLVFGIALTLLALVWLAPQPAAVTGPRAKPDDIFLTLNDANLSGVIANSLTEASLPFQISNVHAHIEPGNIVMIAGDTSFGFLPSRQIKATARLAARGGHLNLHITQGSIGGLQLPGPLVGAIENALNNEFVTLGGQLTLGHVKYSVTGVSTTSGILTLSLGGS